MAKTASPTLPALIERILAANITPSGGASITNEEIARELEAMGCPGSMSTIAAVRNSFFETVGRAYAHGLIKYPALH